MSTNIYTTAGSSKYTIIMPLNVNDKNANFSTFYTIGLPSYVKYLAVEDVENFIIISPATDLDIIRSAVLPVAHNIPFVFLSDEELLPTFEGKNWHKQQAIKLAVSSKVTTDHYLLVDSDQFLLSGLSRSDLFTPDGRIKYSFEPYHTDNGPDHSTNSNWWGSSCSYWDVPIELIRLDKQLMGVTPQVFYTPGVKAMVKIIHERSQTNSLTEVFTKFECTEYTLYWIFVKYISSENLFKLYSPSNTLWTHDTARNGLVQQDLAALKVMTERAIDDRLTKFCTIQGYFNYSQDWIIELSNVIFSKPSYTADDYKALMDEFTVYDVPCKKIRIGNRHDGGYIVADIYSAENTVSTLFAYGVGNNINFEEHFSSIYHPKQFHLYDHTVNMCHPNFHKQGIDYFKHGELNTFKNQMDESGVEKDRKMFLKIDVEGWEYLSFLTTPDEYLDQFTQIVMEVHWLHNDCNGLLVQKKAMMQKLNRLFYLVHVHPNNCATTMTTPLLMHPVLELTWVRKDLVPIVPLSTKNFRLDIDFPNDIYRPNVEMANFYPYAEVIPAWEMRDLVQLKPILHSKDRRYCSFSIIESPNSYRSISRVITSDGDTSAQWLTFDKLGNQLGEEVSLCNGDDVRIFSFKGDNWVYTYRFDSRNTIPIITNVRTGRTTLMWSQTLKDNGKNWTFYEYQSELYMIYTFQPLIICKVNPISGEYTIVHSVDNIIDFPFHHHTKIGPLRGGTDGIVDGDFVFGIGHEQGNFYKPFLWVLNLKSYLWAYQYPSNMKTEGTYTINPFNIWKSGESYLASMAIADGFITQSVYNDQKIVTLLNLRTCVDYLQKVLGK